MIDESVNKQISKNKGQITLIIKQVLLYLIQKTVNFSIYLIKVSVYKDRMSKYRVKQEI